MEKTYCQDFEHFAEVLTLETHGGGDCDERGGKKRQRKEKSELSLEDRYLGMHEEGTGIGGNRTRARHLPGSRYKISVKLLYGQFQLLF